MKVLVADNNNTIKLNEKGRYEANSEIIKSSLLLNITLLVNRHFLICFKKKVI